MRALAGSLPLLLAAVTALGCSGPERPAAERPRPHALDAGVIEAPPPIEPQGPIVPEDERAPEGAACTRTDECASGAQCRGAPGCNSDWACGEPRECMDEAVAYCDCDGVTFYAAGGCAGRPYAHVGPCESVGEAIAAGTELGIHDWDEPPTEDARACESSSGCGRGQVCWGVAGCATTWSCVRARGCRRDSVPYCGCDGETFTASSTCPGRPFVHRGACREAIARADVGSGVPPGEREGSAPEGLAETPTRDQQARDQQARDQQARDQEARDQQAAGTTRDAGTATASRTRESETTIARTDTVRTEARDAGAALAMSSPEAPVGPQGCRSNRDCRRGQVCQGPPGCGGEVEWTCGAPERACVRDTQVFCDCEGNDFRASMFCPARPYRHRGSCEIDRMLDLSGAAVR